MRLYLYLIIFLNILNAKIISYCPNKRIDTQLIKQLIKKQQTNSNSRTYYTQDKKGRFYISINLKKSNAEQVGIAVYSKKGNLLRAGMYGYNAHPTGWWCYKVKDKYMYKNIDKKITKHELSLIAKYNTILQENSMGFFRVTDTFENIIGIDYNGFVIFLDVKKRELLRVNYYMIDSSTSKEKLKKYNRCIKNSIKRKKTKRQIIKNCNLYKNNSYETVVTDVSWQYDSFFKDSN